MPPSNGFATPTTWPAASSWPRCCAGGSPSTRRWRWCGLPATSRCSCSPRQRVVGPRRRHRRPAVVPAGAAHLVRGRRRRRRAGRRAGAGRVCPAQQRPALAAAGRHGRYARRRLPSRPPAGRCRPGTSGLGVAVRRSRSRAGAGDVGRRVPPRAARPAPRRSADFLDGAASPPLLSFAGCHSAYPEGDDQHEPLASRSSPSVLGPMRCSRPTSRSTSSGAAHRLSRPSPRRSGRKPATWPRC